MSRPVIVDLSRDDADSAPAHAGAGGGDGEQAAERTAEGAEILASAAARLFRFDAAAAEWVDRGPGRALVCRAPGADLSYVKFVESGTKKCRAVHNIVPRYRMMRLEPHQERAVRYQCMDMSEAGEARPCTFALSFDHADEQRQWEGQYMLAWEEKVPAVGLAEMVRGGAVAAGDGVLTVKDRDRIIRGTLRPDGSISYGGSTYNSLTTFATAALGRAAGNGWERVKYNNGQRMSECRRAFLATAASRSDAV